MADRISQPPGTASSAIGTSPFHVKGLVYIRTRGYFDAYVPGGFRALIESMPDPALRAFISQQFLAMRWYDALPVEPLVRAEAARTHQTVSAYLKKRAGWQAEEDIKSVYSLLLRIASPERVANHLPRLMSQIVDFGVLTVEPGPTGGVVMRMRGMPALLVPWYQGGFAAYAERALLLAGAKKVAYDITVSPPSGEQAGVTLVDLVVSLRWF
ncbi:MAG: hypothetical protein WCJ30_10825 [Deltaproteobacteria bacterium]